MRLDFQTKIGYTSCDPAKDCGFFVAEGTDKPNNDILAFGREGGQCIATAVILGRGNVPTDALAAFAFPVKREHPTCDGCQAMTQIGRLVTQGLCALFVL
jgi:hypothetical protein